MALSPEPKMTEKSSAARPRGGGLLQPWPTLRVQGTAVWESSPERSPYESYASFPDQLTPSVLQHRNTWGCKMWRRLALAPKAERLSALHRREEKEW